MRYEFLGNCFDPNVVRYEPLTADYRYFGGEFEAPTPFDIAKFNLYSIPGLRVDDDRKPPESTLPRTVRTEIASSPAGTLEISGCPDCGFKLFFGNPAGIPPCDPYRPGDCDDGVDPHTDPLSAAMDFAHEMEFSVSFKGAEVPAYIEQTWFTVVGGDTMAHTAPLDPTGCATVNPRTGHVVYYGDVNPDDVLSISVDPLSSIYVEDIPPASDTLIDDTGIIDLINEARNARPYRYTANPYPLGQSISDLNKTAYTLHSGDDREEIAGNDSEKNWRLADDGSTIDPKFESTSQFVWAQAMGAIQFQIWQLIGTDYGLGHMTEIFDEEVASAGV